MRFHSLHFETAATENEIRKQQADARRKASTEANTPSNAQPKADGDEVDDTTDQETLEAYAAVLTYAMDLAKTAGKRTGRPNFATMSLMRRCKEYVGLPGGKPLVSNDTTKRFRDVYTAGPAGDFGEIGYSKTFKDVLKAVQTEVFARQLVVLTTMSNANDSLVRTCYFPKALLWDEVASSIEPETLIPWTTFLGSLEWVVGCG